MKAAIFLAAAGVAVAQNLSGEPPCATSCIASAITAAGCDANDQGCACGPTQTAIAALAAPCLIKACTAASDLLAAQSVGAELCVEYSAGLNATATPTGAGTGSGTSVSATATGTSGSSSSGGSGTTTGSGSAPTGGSNSTVTSGQPSNTKSGSPSTAESPSGTNEPSGTNTAGGVPTESTNLAAAAKPLAIGALAALMAAIAAL
ncbi:hypothetical protein QBC33DRAFT_549268 [Phialemonium atrogriseum]|uniref:CFEM domain-containing protein n=1 Tax=Phialemonium atrogriseum TaxID=1093897 RepID=A0AAJ0BS90_9PEZI|nr:uncharacterized protein QBC33DRAFT_549268 [Phialemonium atrogriseum]KAK1763539.1 hypothetical protein QBC33DRAFT_549268 [Phialemonium atrogriseum]